MSEYLHFKDSLALKNRDESIVKELVKDLHQQEMTSTADWIKSSIVSIHY